eukprot:6525807-Pyramimonas_sp.AAC.1
MPEPRVLPSHSLPAAGPRPATSPRPRARMESEPEQPRCPIPDCSELVRHLRQPWQSSASLSP